MTKTIRICVVVGVLALLLPETAAAYVGPGAGFAIVSSFLTLLVATLYSLLALVTWPIRQLIRLLRRRKAYGKAKVKRVVVIGLDGMDPKLAARFMDEGKLPNFAALRDKGTFSPLATTCPPISPVAWSTFLTGVNPGKHNIYDFLARDPHSYQPLLSSVEIARPKRSLRVGRYHIPLGKPQLKRLRKAKPFWHFLGEAGVFCSVIRVPITFPPEKFPGVLLSGMCVPDMKGTQGTFSFHTTKATSESARQSGVVIPFESRNGHFASHIPGPPNELVEGGGELRVPFTARRLPNGAGVEIEIDGRRFALKLGEYSEWIEIKFRSGLGMNANGICRFYLKQLAPEMEVYVTPVNINPMKPSLPISHPLTYSIYLSKLFGPFATLGLAEDTWALNEDAIGDDAFLEQCYMNHAERENMFFDALKKTSQGLCACVWDTTDRVQHMFWRYMEKDHPALRKDGKDRHRYAGVIADLYKRMDDLVGRTLKHLDDKTLLLVISDHGFASFARGINLNTWLLQNGYLKLKDGQSGSGDWFADVDWSQTRAYAMGLNGIYINQRGREMHGIVTESEAAQLKKELCARIAGLKDPENGRTGVTEVWENQSVYSGPYRENSPDLVIGYAGGYRASWDCVMGRVVPAIFDDNTKAWSGDHCIDARLVPGILFSNKKITGDDPAIVDMAPTILNLFGLPKPAHFDGKPLSVTV